ASVSGRLVGPRWARPVSHPRGGHSTSGLADAKDGTRSISIRTGTRVDTCAEPSRLGASLAAVLSTPPLRRSPPMPSRRPALRVGPLTAIACTLAALAAPLAESATAAAPTPIAMPALSRATMDAPYSPCRDFNRYGNGGWLDANTIPPAYPVWGSFSALAERNQEVLHGILEHAASDKKAAPASSTGKLGAYWCACMDSAKADAAGTRPIQAVLADIDAMTSPADLPARVASLHDAVI